MHSLRISHSLALAGLLVSAYAASGQAASSLAALNSAPTKTSAVLHATTTQVLVDVVVTDHGKPVRGIDRSRFHLFEDGREQAIDAFEEHQPPAPVNASQSAVRVAVLPPHTYTNVSPYPDTGTVNVLLLDALNTPMADQARARKQMIEYLDKIPSGTPIAIFTLASHLQLVTGFTTNAAYLAEVMKGKAASPSHSVVTENQANSEQLELENEMADLGANPGAPQDYIIAMQEFENDLTAVQTNLRVRVTLDAFQELARYLSGIPGRKNLIWFSGSFPITIDPDPEFPRSMRNMDEYGAEIRRTGALLTAARAAVYPVDSRGLMTSTSTDASYTPSTNFMKDRSPMNRDDTTFQNQTAEEHSSMQTVAEETGGKALFNSNDLKGAVESAIEDGSSYYTIAYIPAGLKLDGNFHRIKVTVDPGRYRLAYRDGYYADPGYGPGSGAQNPEGAKLITSAILHGAPSSTQILMQARVLPATDPLLKNASLPTGPAGKMAADIKGPPHLYVIDLSVDPRGITFSDAADGGHDARVEFLLVGYDAEGNRVNYQDQTLGIKLNPKQFESSMANGLHARVFLDLPAGPGFLRIAVQDLNAGRAGSLEVPLEAAK
jgi:VWFA-related protein